MCRLDDKKTCTTQQPKRGKVKQNGIRHALLKAATFSTRFTPQREIKQRILARYPKPGAVSLRPRYYRSLRKCPKCAEGAAFWRVK